MNETSDFAAAEEQIRAVVAAYNGAVRANDADGFRKAFHPTSSVVHYQERKGAIDVKTLDEFIEQIAGLHENFGNAVEVSDAVHVDISGNIASVRVPFRFQMGDKEFSGVNIFALAVDDGNLAYHEQGVFALVPAHSRYSCL